LAFATTACVSIRDAHRSPPKCILNFAAIDEEFEEENSHDFSIQYLGTATVLIRVGPFRFITDPAFDPSGTEYDFGPWYSPKWWAYSEKSGATALSIDEVGAVNAVLLSHDQHGDNLDHLGRELLTRSSVQAVLTTTYAQDRLARDVDRDAIRRYVLGGGLALAEKTHGLEPWESCVLTKKGFDVAITATPALHGPSMTPMVDEVIGFLLEWKNQGTKRTLYISGDTILNDEVRKIPENFAKIGVSQIDYALIHVGGVRFPKMWIFGEDLFTFDTGQAMEFIKLLKPKNVFLVHHSDWSHFMEDYAATKNAFELDVFLGPRSVFLDKGQTWRSP
jgi:L-ascorbate metabolism protein UlaG (beta-lactamase superfamily)